MIQVEHMNHGVSVARWFLLAAFAAAWMLSACTTGDDGAPRGEAYPAGDDGSPSGEVAQVPLSITSMTSPVDPGDTATVVAETAPNADCELVYATPAGTVSFAAGLGSHTADAEGRLSWTWRINPATSPGVGTLRLTCNGQTLAAVIQVQGSGTDDDADD